MPRRSFISFFTFRKNLGPSGKRVHGHGQGGPRLLLRHPVLGDVVNSSSLGRSIPFPNSLKKSSTTDKLHGFGFLESLFHARDKSDFIASASSAVTEPSASKRWR